MKNIYIFNKFFFIPNSYDIFCYCIFTSYEYKVARCNEKLKNLSMYVNILILVDFCLKGLSCLFPDF